MSDTEQGTEQAEPTEAPPTPPHTVIGPEPDAPAPGVEGEPMPSEPAEADAPTEGEGEGDATDDTSDGGSAGE